MTSPDGCTKWKPVTIAVPFLPSSPKPICTLIQTHTKKRETARVLMDAAKKELTEKYDGYIRTPIKHPDYFDAWMSFRSRRWKELSNKKKLSENAKSEWQENWKKFLNIRLENDLELKELEIKKGVGIAHKEVIQGESETQNLSDVIEEVDFNIKDKKQSNIHPQKNEVESQKLPSLVNQPRSPVNRPQSVRSPINRSPSPIDRQRSPCRGLRSPRSQHQSLRNQRQRSRLQSPRNELKSTKYRHRSQIKCTRSPPRNRSQSPSQSPRKHPQLPYEVSSQPSEGLNYQSCKNHFRSMSKSTEIRKITTGPTSSKTNYSSVSEPKALASKDSRSYEEPIKSQDITSDPNSSLKQHPTETEISKKPTDLKTDEAITIMSVLRLLIVLEDILGSLGPNVIELMTKAITMDKTKSDYSNQLLDNEECYIVFEMIKEKLKGLLTVNMVEVSRIVSVKKAIKDMNTLVQEAIDRRAAIAAKISLAFMKQGITNISHKQLQHYTDKYIKMANAKRNYVGNEQIQP